VGKLGEEEKDQPACGGGGSGGGELPCSRVPKPDELELGLMQ